jgi:hypothetical protein
MREAIAAGLLLVVGFAHEADVVRSFTYQSAKAASCIARNFDTENVRAVRICF